MKKKNKKVNAAILVIGNEILSGRTQDKNVSFISNWLNLKCGISVNEVRIIPDLERVIVKNILELSKNFNYVFTTGGIGPTHDDITAKSISKALNVKYEYHKEAFKILENYYSKSKFNDGRKKMAKMPRGAKLIYNPSSAAPGFIIKNIISLPGVPSILNSMIENCKRYLIKGSMVHSKTLNLFTVESNISKKLPASVIFSTGWTLRPFSYRKPWIPIEISPLIGLQPACPSSWVTSKHLLVNEQRFSKL